MKVLYTAAHAAAGPQVPIGGGGAIARLLAAEWGKTNPFPFEIITPEDTTPEQMVKYSEGEYAEFCFRFRRFSTNRIVAEDPQRCVVLVNDISEGPDFALLARHGYRVFTIWHVDVVGYVAQMYLRGLIPARYLSRWTRPFVSWMPRLAQLVFRQQLECVEHSAGHIVMTNDMREAILAGYPRTPREKIHVIPWGAPPQEAHSLPRRDFSERVLLTLSRISPEKGQDRLLHALQKTQSSGTLLLCGDAAFMQGRRFLTRLHALAAWVKNWKVQFPGHLSGQAKTDAFSRADLFIFPSRFESYGLTLMEALSHGLPVVAFASSGARAIVRPEFGVLVETEAEMAHAIDTLLADPQRRQAMSLAAREYAAAHPFAKAAEALASLLVASAR